MTATLDQRGGHSQQPSSLITNHFFFKVWKAYLPTLRIINSGIDFFETCTTLKNCPLTLPDRTTRTSVLSARQKNLDEAALEFIYYRDLQKESERDPGGDMIHLVFDFAEMVLLPHLVRQPGQLHFIASVQVQRLAFLVFPVASIQVGMCLDYRRIIGRVVKRLMNYIQCSTTLFNNILFLVLPALPPEFSIYTPTTVPDKTIIDLCYGFWLDQCSPYLKTL